MRKKYPKYTLTTEAYQKKIQRSLLTAAHRKCTRAEAKTWRAARCYKAAAPRQFSTKIRKQYAWSGKVGTEMYGNSLKSFTTSCMPHNGHGTRERDRQRLHVVTSNPDAAHLVPLVKRAVSVMHPILKFGKGENMVMLTGKAYHISRPCLLRCKETLLWFMHYITRENFVSHLMGAKDTNSLYDCNEIANQLLWAHANFINTVFVLPQCYHTYTHLPSRGKQISQLQDALQQSSKHPTTMALQEFINIVNKRERRVVTCIVTHSVT